MTTRVELTTAKIVGAMASWQGAAPFHRAPLVLCTEFGRGVLIKVSRYLHDAAEGESVPAAEWESLQRLGEAMPLAPEKSPVPGAWLWMLRERFAIDRGGCIEELKKGSHLVDAPQIGDNGDIACIVVERGLAGLREAWANRAARLAEDALRRRNAVRALATAETAFGLEPQMSPRRLALLALAYRLLGRPIRADGYIEMAGRSTGREFAAEVRAEIDALEISLGLRRLTPSVRGTRGTLAERRVEAIASSPLGGNRGRAA